MDWDADSSMVRASDSKWKGRGFDSRWEWPDNFLLQSAVCADLFRYPFHPHASAVARQIFCQTCRSQVTAIHTCT